MKLKQNLHKADTKKSQHNNDNGGKNDNDDDNDYLSGWAV